MFPNLSNKYKKLYSNNYIVNSTKNLELMSYFYKRCNDNGIVCDNDKIFEYLNTFEEKPVFEQISFF